MESMSILIYSSVSVYLYMNQFLHVFVYFVKKQRYADTKEVWEWAKHEITLKLEFVKKHSIKGIFFCL